MKIGFEAKRAFTNGTGLGHYSRTLISSLAKYFVEDDYYLFTPKQTNLFKIDSIENIKTIIPTHFPASIFRSAWRSSWVKKDLVKLKSIKLKLEVRTLVGCKMYKGHLIRLQV